MYLKPSVISWLVSNYLEWNLACISDSMAKSLSMAYPRSYCIADNKMEF